MHMTVKALVAHVADVHVLAFSHLAYMDGSRATPGRFDTGVELGRHLLHYSMCACILCL